jgi:hypothetical protein
MTEMAAEWHLGKQTIDEKILIAFRPLPFFVPFNLFSKKSFLNVFPNSTSSKITFCNNVEI